MSIFSLTLISALRTLTTVVWVTAGARDEPWNFFGLKEINILNLTLFLPCVCVLMSVLTS